MTLERLQCCSSAGAPQPNMLSPDADATWLPSGEKAKALTERPQRCSRADLPQLDCPVP